MAANTQATGPGMRRYRLSIRQYLAAIEGDVFPETAHLELLGGVLVEKMTKNPPHNIVILRLSKIFHQILPEAWLVSEEKPVKLGRFWYPEPDIAIIRGPDYLYEKRAPLVRDLGFLIEVAESSYSIDRGKKWRLYASARVAVYWIVNIQQQRIEVYSDPSGHGRSASYFQVATFIEGDTAPVVLDGLEIGRIAVSDILPRA